MEAQPASQLLPRTAAYLARIKQRREELQERFAQIFSRRSDFVLEVGCGHGHFLTAYAQAHPATLCIGIDIENDRIGRAVRKRDRAKLENLHFIHSEARLFLNTLPSAAR